MEKDIPYGVIKNIDLELSENAISQSLSYQNNIEIANKRRGSACESK